MEDTSLPSAGMLMQCPQAAWPCAVPSAYACSASCVYMTWGAVRGGASGISSVTLTARDVSRGEALGSASVTDITLTSGSLCFSDRATGSLLEVRRVGPLATFADRERCPAAQLSS